MLKHRVIVLFTTNLHKCLRWLSRFKNLGLYGQHLFINKADKNCVFVHFDRAGIQSTLGIGDISEFRPNLLKYVIVSNNQANKNVCM